jgi:hypothetical protein
MTLPLRAITEGKNFRPGHQGAGMLRPREEKKETVGLPERRKSINPPLQRLKSEAQVEHFSRLMRLND